MKESEYLLLLTYELELWQSYLINKKTRRYKLLFIHSKLGSKLQNSFFMYIF
jgi:hypothetical protein